MSTYGWTIDQVNEMTVPQMTALIEEIRESHRPAGPEVGTTDRWGQESALDALSGHVVDEVL